MGSHPSLTRDELEVLLEIRDPDDWDKPASAWDFSVWDGSGVDNAWSDASAGFIDVICDLRGFTMDRGRQTDWDDFQAGTVELSLDNSSGMYSVYGSRAWPRIRPGLGVMINATWNGRKHQLFVGDMVEYREGQSPGDYAVTIKAVDGFRRLADPIGVEYSPGIPQEQTGDRINRVLARIGTFKKSIARGDATMTNYLTSRTVLDEVKMTAMSDGGIFFVDNDGTYTYMGKERINGRPLPNWRTIPSFTDACDGGLPYAAVEPILADNEFGNVITVSNVSQGTDSPAAATAVDQQSIDLNGRYLWAPSQLVICNANWVQSLANFQRDRRSTAFYRINSFECYPAHDSGIWDALLPMRLCDSLFVTRTPPESDTIHAAMICDGIRIEATPQLWKWVIRCSPGDSIDTVDFWDFGVWDTASWL